MTTTGGGGARGPFWALRRRLRPRDDRGSAQLVTFIVGAAVFLVATTQLVHFVIRPPGASQDALAHEDLKARGTSVLQVLLGSSGFPATWSTDATSIDAVQRLGLLQDASTLRMDPAKFDALARGSASTRDPQNGLVDYAEAKTALGLDGYDFHIRANPVFASVAAGTFGMDEMGGLRVAYLGHWDGVGPSQDAASEIADLAQLAAASDDGLVFDDTVRVTADGAGDVFTDAGSDLRSILVPNLGTKVTNTILPGGSASVFHLVDASEYRGLFASAAWPTLSTALALTDGASAPTLGYSNSKEVRVTLGVANFSTLSIANPLALTWQEFVDADDDGDFGFVEISPDGGQTWFALTDDALGRSQDSAAHPQAPPDDWATRAVPVTTSSCGPCAANSDVLVAFHWVANAAESGAGWIIDDVKITPTTATGFDKSFEAPAYDAIVVGSDVAQGTLTAIEMREAIRDHVDVHDGRIIVLGSDEQTLSWLAPLFHVGVADVGGGVAAPDTTHPLLTVPNEISWQRFATGERSWDLTGPEPSALFNVILGDSLGEAVLAATKTGAFGDHGAKSGSVVLAAYQLPELSHDDALRFLANALALGKHHYLYLDAGPTVPSDVPVGSLSRTATMDKSADGSKDFTEMRITLYLWMGTAGSTESSVSSWGTPMGSPSPPRNVDATSSDGAVDLSWDAPSSGGLSSIVGYRIHRSTTSGAQTPYAVRALPGTLTWHDTAVTNGVTYYYNVTAYNAHGSSKTSNEASATPATLPTAPQGLSATGGLALVALAWTAPTANGGALVTNYEIWRAIDAGASTLLTTIGANTTFDDLTVGSDPDGPQYSYKIRAVTAIGASPYSNEEVAGPASLPSAPILTATDGVGEIVLTWTVPADGGTDLVGYRVYAGNSAGTETHLDYVDSALGVDTNYVETVVAGTTRYYRVAAISGMGEGPLSAEDSATSIGLPGVPPTLDVTESLPRTLHLAWGLATGSPTSYKIYAGNSAGTEALIYQTTAPTPNTTFDDAGLANGQPRYYKVTAVTAAGESAPASDSATTWNTPDTLTVTATGGIGSIALTWTAPADNGAALTGYHIYASSSSAQEQSLAWVNSTNGATTAYTETGLSNGETRYYKVTAINAVGESGLSDEKSATTLALPGTPGAVTVTESVAGTLHLSWSAPATGGAPTSYKVYRGTTLGTYTLIYTTSTTNTTYDDAGLGNGATRYYQITAVNGAGESLVGSLGSGTTWSLPGAPVVVGSAASSHHVALTITAPVSNGGTSITDYQIYYCQGAACTPATPYSTSNQLTYTDTHGTAALQTWRFKAAAVNAVGEGSASAIISVVTT